MAENKTVPLTLGIGGPTIGTASIYEDGLIVAELVDGAVRKRLFGTVEDLSIGFN